MFCVFAMIYDLNSSNLAIEKFDWKEKKFESEKQKSVGSLFIGIIKPTLCY